MIRLRPAPLLVIVIIAAWLQAGCGQDAINQQNRELLEKQQAQLDQLKQQVAALEVQQSRNTYATAPAGGCDASVMHEASRKAGERFAAGDFPHALGYYQDAVSACPANAQAQLNVARTYEAIGDRAQALAHYRLAADATGANADTDAVRQAHDAIARLHG